MKLRENIKTAVEGIKKIGGNPNWYAGRHLYILIKGIHFFLRL